MFQNLVKIFCASESVTGIRLHRSDGDHGDAGFDVRRDLVARAMINHNHTAWLTVAVVVSLMALPGCWYRPSAITVSRDYNLGGAPVDPPTHQPVTQYDDCVAGAEVYRLHCGRCHNARPLGERPFAFNEISAAHMRDQAYLTGKEYRALIHFMRRWADVGPPTAEVLPSPKRLIFSQPISEVRPGADTSGLLPPSGGPSPASSEFDGSY